VPLDPWQGIGYTKERSEHEYLVGGASPITLMLKGRLDTAM